MTDISENLKYHQRPVFVNLLLLTVTVILFIFKLIFSIITNSLALQADAFDNLTDIVMALAALIGIVYSRKKPNEKFPYGYYKIENIISLIISLFIFFTAYNILSQSVKNILDFFSGSSKIINKSNSVFIFLVISFSISVLLTLYLKKIGKKTNSPIIKSQASEKLFDNFISLSVLVGFIGIIFNLFILDSFIGLFIVFFIIKGGYDIFLTSTKTLLDAVIDFDKRTDVYKLIESFPKIKKIESLEIRSYGRYIFLEIAVDLNRDLSLTQILTLKNLIITSIKERFPQIFKVIILVQTQENPITKIAIPLKDNNGLNSKISDHFGESLFFALFEIKEGEKGKTLLNYNIITNEFINEEKRKGILISDWLTSNKIDKVYLKKDLKIGPKLIFEKALIVMETTQLDNLNDIINLELGLSKN
ncbi:MAG: cation diffusion facilitator family transporter [Promethearchaeota archaeon]